jgi:hypothetical protein
VNLSPVNLTIADGFKFGCGLLLAGAFALALLILTASLAVLIASILGIRLPLPGA